MTFHFVKQTKQIQSVGNDLSQLTTEEHGITVGSAPKAQSAGKGTVQDNTLYLIYETPIVFSPIPFDPVCAFRNGSPIRCSRAEEAPQYFHLYGR